MVQSTEAGQGMNSATDCRTTLDRPPRWSVFRQPQMRPILVTIADILSHQPLQMPLIEHDHVVQQVATAAPDPTLRDTVLPRTLSLCLIRCSSGGSTTPVQTLMTSPPALGGSNYGWYHLDAPCNREPYGVVYNYNTAQATIDAQLQQMYSNGQRRLRIPIFHGRGIDSGTVMDSTGGNLAPRFQTNLANLLAAIKAAGFVELEVSFHPQGGNDPTKWTTFRADYFQENWSLIQNLRTIIAAAGIPYHIDLSNEGIPPQGYAAFLEYSQELWNDYAGTFGTSDTIGFSIIADDAHVSQVSMVYGPSAFGNSGSPQLFDVHVYTDAGNSFTTAFNSLNAQGYQGVPWVIGEAYYNDATEAAALRQAVNSTGQTVQYLTQWPVTSDLSCSPDVNVAPPADFSNYQAQNF